MRGNPDIMEILEERVARHPVECGIVIPALLDFLRATRRAKLAEVAALERFERSLLTIQGASLVSEA
jgi:hypothetical protein